MNTRRMAGTRGVTLIEVAVAILLLSVGAVALAGLTSATARMVESGARYTRQAALLTDRLESLLADPCAARAGVERRPPFVIQWKATPEPGGIRLSVWADATVGTDRQRVITRFAACAP